MTSKRYNSLPKKTLELESEKIEKILPTIKKNCTVKFNESIDLEQAVKIIAGSARSMGIEVKE